MRFTCHAGLGRLRVLSAALKSIRLDAIVAVFNTYRFKDYQEGSMPLVQAKCTNCGATIPVDNVKDAAICPYCGSAFIVEKAINNYNVTNNIQAGVVNFYGTTNDFDVRGGVLIKYNGVSMQPVIPDTVVKIGEFAFSGSMISSVVIPDTVISIGESAFNRCDNLKEITLPGGIKNLESGIFSSCKNLVRVTLPERIPHIEDIMFFGCTSLTSFNIPEGVTSIGSSAFQNCCNLTSVILPNSLKKIGMWAFENTGLLSIEIPTGVGVIESYAFSRCYNLNEAKIPTHYLANIDISYDDYMDHVFWESPVATKVLATVRRLKHLCVYCGSPSVKRNGRCASCGKNNVF